MLQPYEERKIAQDLDAQIDLSIEPTPENARRTHAALKAAGYDMTDLTVEDLVEKKRTENIIVGVRASFASLDDLIEMKKAADRQKDLDD